MQVKTQIRESSFLHELEEESKLKISAEGFEENAGRNFFLPKPFPPNFRKSRRNCFRRSFSAETFGK